MFSGIGTGSDRAQLARRDNALRPGVVLTGASGVPDVAEAGLLPSLVCTE